MTVSKGKQTGSYKVVSLEKIAGNLQMSHDVFTTSLQYRCNVTTLQRRCNDVAATFVFAGLFLNKLQTGKTKKEKYK